MSSHDTQYVSLLKSRAHELDAVDAKSSYASSSYQSIHQVESDRQSDRDGRHGHSGQRKDAVVEAREQ